MMLFKKEKEVIELILKHLDAVEESLQSGIKTIECYLEDNISEAKILGRKVRSLESEADIVRYNIRDKLYSGAYLPLLREDIYKLIESIDKEIYKIPRCIDSKCKAQNNLLCQQFCKVG